MAIEEYFFKGLKLRIVSFYVLYLVIVMNEVTH